MPRVVGRAEYRTPPPQDPPSAAGTARMPDAPADTTVPANSGGQERSDPGFPDAPTTRFSVAKNAVKNAVNTATSAARSTRPSAPPAPDQEIESWLGELRGKPGTPGTPGAPIPPPPPSAEPTTTIPAPDYGTTAIPAPRDPDATEEVPPSISAEETRAIPVSRPEQGDSEVATEKLNSRGKNEDKEPDEQRRRGTGGGVSAADLLRREGRL